MLESPVSEKFVGVRRGCALSVFVMAYNEAASLEQVVREIESSVQSTVTDWEIVVIDDGSTDGTAEVADRLARDVPGVRVVHHASNCGLGGVYRTGFVAARGDYLTFLPADGQFPASIIGQFLPLMDRNDLVLGYLPQRGVSLGRLLSLAERCLYRVLFGRLPRFQGVMMVRRRLLVELPLRSTGRGWAIVMELLIRASRTRRRMTSVPTAYRPRLNGRSKVNNPRNVWANVRQIVALRGLL